MKINFKNANAIERGSSKRSEVNEEEEEEEEVPGPPLNLRSFT